MSESSEENRETHDTDMSLYITLQLQDSNDALNNKPTLEFKSLEQPVLLGDHSEMEPPDPLPNSEVKRLSADGSVGFLHARVGHRQAPNYEIAPIMRMIGAFFV